MDHGRTRPRSSLGQRRVRAFVRYVLWVGLIAAWRPAYAQPAPDSDPGIRFTAREQIVFASRPLWQIRLIDGDTLTGELLRGDHNSLEARVFGQSRLRIPWQAVEHLRLLPGDRILLDEPISADQPAGDAVLPKQGEAVSVHKMFPAVSGDFRCLLQYRVPPGDAVEGTNVSVLFRFRSGTLVAATLDAQSVWSATIYPATHAPAPGNAVWQTAANLPGDHRLSLRRVAQRIYLSRDDVLLAALTIPEDVLESVEVRVKSPADSQSSPFQPLHLTLVQRTMDIPVEPGPQPAADGILSATGELWWGDLQRLSAAGAEWSDSGDAWSIPWHDIRSVVPRIRHWDRPLRPMSGGLVELHLQPPAERPDSPGDHFTVMLRSSRGRWLMVEHPLLGMLAIPREALRQVVPIVEGTWQVLEPRQVALPASRRHSVSAAECPGGEFTLDQLPDSPVILLLEVSGLEPAGPETPPGSPTLRGLRAGQDGTELWINDRQAVRWNDLTSQWTLPGEFDRLQTRVPPEMFRSGLNTWRIVQRPGGRIPPRAELLRMRRLSRAAESGWP